MTLPFSKSPRRSGIALVVVLATLVLVTVLVVGFLILASGAVRSSTAYGRSGEARYLADSAMGLAIGQIAQATSQETLESGDTRAWTSQPGLIRVFGSDGLPYQSYKLYSAADMILNHAGGSGFNLGSSTSPVDVPSDWASRPAEFVDINQRFTVDGLNYFPVLDVTAAQSGTAVEGFSLGNFTPAAQGQMPVRWLYVLQDGKINLPGSDGTVPGASRSNPIVGRVAFWTDDETCKVNINTASEGVFWDMPRASGESEMKFSRYQPYANEWQRVTGHPAMTSLSSVFGNKWPVVRQLSQATYDDNLKAYYALSPRVDLGGSMGGTKTVDAATYGPIVAEPGRLYSSLDELLFNDLRAANPSVGTLAPPLTPADLERAKFFATAHSRSPDLNLFNLPRISLWPQMVLDPAEESSRNVKERLIAFCSEMGGVAGSRPKYYFQRQNSRSATKDWTDIPRNQDLYKYLQRLTARPIPGVGASFLQKYGNDERNQILTSMFDFIRSGVNLIDSSKDSSIETPPAERRYKLYPTDFSYPSGSPAAGQVVPIEINPPGGGKITRGYGRYPTVVGASLVFYYIGRKYDDMDPTDPGYHWLDLDVDGDTWPRKLPDATWTAKSPFNPTHPQPVAGMNPPIQGNKNTRIGATFIVHLFVPSVGLVPYSADLGVRIKGLSGITVSDTTGPVATNFPSSATTRFHKWGHASEGGYGNYYEYSFQTGSSNAGIFTSGQAKRMAHNPDNSSASHSGYYPFVAAGSGNFQGPDGVSYPYLDVAGPTFSFSGADIEIEILPAHYDNPKGNAGNRSGNQSQVSNAVVQTFKMKIEGASGLPVPNAQHYRNEVGSPKRIVGFYAPFTWRNGDFPADDYINRIDKVPIYTGKRLRASHLTPGDIVRSMVLAPQDGPKADARLVAMRTEVPDTFFAPAPGYNTSVRIADGGLARNHSGANQYQRFATSLANAGVGGTLVEGLRYWLRAVPGSSGISDADFQPNTNWSGFPLVPGSRTAANPNSETFFPAALNKDADPGDWDNGPGSVPDGPYINKPDEGHDRGSGTGSSLADANYPAYYGPTTWQDLVKGKTFAPNRQIASSVMFGSLPSRAASGDPWETLAFAPNQPAGSEHRGISVEPKDHYLLDLFTMPIVEPYAISEPYSTAGRLNMNYRIAPFTYIRRATGMHAVLKPLRFTAIPDAAADRYSKAFEPATVADNYRRALDTASIEQTLEQFEQKFDSLDRFNDGKHAFLSASEISEIFLVPSAETLANMTDPSGFWSTHRLTGDNSREAPYNDLYPRLTTRSNTYTVHVVAQALRQKAGANTADWSRWQEGKDSIEAEWRGSFTIERYIPEGESQQVVPDFAGPTPPSESLAGKYRLRTLRTKQFSP